MPQITIMGESRTAKNALSDARSLPINASSVISGVYIHVPFCFHKCHYCDFYSIVDSQPRQEIFAERLATEWRAMAGLSQTASVETIFVGGGTPTLLWPDLWQAFLETIHETQLLRLVEFTVEANPETVTADLLRVLAGGGVNRLSIGAQSFHLALLQVLERHHDPANVSKSVELARDAGISNLNLDLIFAIPGQTLDQWKADLESALALNPTHLSCYSLMYEPNTALTQKMALGRISRVDEHLEAEMYGYAIDCLDAAGFEHYEVSAWALPGHRCQHNLNYWTNGNWWPLGPSAAGHVGGIRWRNVARLSDYLAHAPWPRIDQVEQLATSDRIGEELMLRLRLRDGIHRRQLYALLDDDLHEPARRASIESQIAAGNLEWKNEALRLTRVGLFVADDVLTDLI